MAEVTSTAISQTVDSNTVTVLQDEDATSQQDLPTLRLKLKKPKSNKRVQWGEDTVDNENMNKKKSKCCCIYNKPKEFGESSSDSDDECDNCQGHVERRKKARGQDHPEGTSTSASSPPPLVPA